MTHAISLTYDERCELSDMLEHKLVEIRTFIKQLKDNGFDPEVYEKEYSFFYELFIKVQCK